MTGLIHQLVHGYQHGHELLASSCKLTPSSGELTTRLSDLSGTLTPDVSFKSYLTGYPLPSGDFYALGRTWPDEGASRAGCVLTHTLLIPRVDWEQSRRPRAFNRLFRPPATEDLSAFKKPVAPEEALRALEGEPSDDAGDSTPSIRSQTFGLDFVCRYFGEGLQPIVWLGDAEAETTTWKILSALWPKLRGSFAFCTLSLQPRVLEGRPFDLLFAPAMLYSRFHSVGREHLVSQDDRLVGRAEAWQTTWAAYTFGRAGPTLEASDMQEVLASLGTDPTSVRLVFLLEDLLRRLQESPTAAAGALDILESIAPLPTALAVQKTRVVERALGSLAQLPSADDAIHAVAMVSERLVRPAFSAVLQRLTSSFVQIASELTQRAPECALLAAEPLLARQSQVGDSPFATGVVLGLLSLGRTRADALWILSHAPNVGPRLIAMEPRLALAYHHAATSRNDWRLHRDLLTWVSQINDPTKRASLRDTLLPELGNEHDAPLVAELLRDTPQESVRSVLDALSTSAALSRPGIRRVIEGQFSDAFVTELRHWAEGRANWPEGLDRLVATTYTRDERGLDGVLGLKLEPLAKAEVLSEFLEMLGSRYLPNWLCKRAVVKTDVLETLLAPEQRLSRPVAEEVSRFLSAVGEQPVHRIKGAPGRIAAFSGFSFYEDLLDFAMRGAIRAVFTGELPVEASHEWQSSTLTEAWMRRVPEWHLQAVFVQAARLGGKALARAWSWIAESPQALFDKGGTVLSLVRSFSEAGADRFSEDIPSSWSRVLSRAESASDNRIHLRLCVHALKTGFSYTREPLGQVVASAFYPVHRAVTESRYTPPEAAELFGYLDWDKGKELRRDLIEAFLQSNWKPGDLAVAAREVWLLRKIVKRLLRKFDGARYLDAMIRDLRERTDQTSSPALLDALLELARNPDFFEDWD